MSTKINHAICQAIDSVFAECRLEFWKGASTWLPRALGIPLDRTPKDRPQMIGKCWTMIRVPAEDLVRYHETGALQDFVRGAAMLMSRTLGNEIGRSKAGFPCRRQSFGDMMVNLVNGEIADAAVDGFFPADNPTQELYYLGNLPLLIGAESDPVVRSPVDDSYMFGFKVYGW